MSAAAASTARAPSLLHLTKGFWAHLSTRRRKQLAVLLVLMVLASFAEVLSLGAVLPFLGVLTQPQKVFDYPALQPLLRGLGIATPHGLLLPITVVFIIAALLAGAMRLLLLYVQTRLSYAIGVDFSYEIYRRTLYQPYAVHVARNSSEVISGVTAKIAEIIGSFLTPVLTLFSSLVIMLAILAALLVVNPLVSLAAVVGFGLIYGVVILATRRRLAAYSRRMAVESTRVVKLLQEGLGGIRDVLLSGSQEAYCNQYRQVEVPYRHAQAGRLFIGGSPRYAVESLGMVFIALLAYAMTEQAGGLVSAIAMLGALALGAQRLLPVLQQGYLATVMLRGGRRSLHDALELLDQPVDVTVYGAARASLPFAHTIRLEGLSFRYTPEGREVLHGLNLTIARGSRTGVMGATGSGKSTLLDLIMGLLKPTAGQIFVDDTPLSGPVQRAWQRRIAHVPQAIYLSDASMAENIAFGVPPEQIDHNRVRRAAQQAQIADYIESLPDRYSTPVGERGVRLSGGQRQRIGIARALYRNAEVIVFDEATSALDSATERAVMDAIDSLGNDLTILIVAHRITTLRRCEQVVELQQGQIVCAGSYEAMVEGPKSRKLVRVAD